MLAKRKIHDYTIPEYGIKFVDRDVEYERFLNWLFRDDLPWNFVLYGPWGCGKSEFARAFTWTLQDAEDIYAVYVDLAREKVSILTFSKPEIEHEVIELLKTTFGKFSELVLNLYKLIKALSKRVRLQDCRVIVFLDEVKRVLSVYGESIEYLVSNAETTVRECKRELKLKSMNIVFVTSEQTAVEEFLRCEGKSLTTLLMWHLPERGLVELLQNLNFRDDVKRAWLLTGGCPRECIEIVRTFRCDVNMWLMDVVDRVLTAILAYIREVKDEKKVLDELRLVVTCVDEILKLRLYDTLLRYNLVTPLVIEYKRLSSIPEGEHVGKRVAFQLPAYYLCIKAIIETGRVHVSYEDVLNMLSKLA